MYQVEVIPSTVSALVASGTPLPGNLTALNLRDEFIGRANATSSITSDLSWTLVLAGSATLTFQNGSWPHIGIGQLATAASAGNAITLNLTVTALQFTTLFSNPSWEAKWLFKLNQTANTRWYIGVYDGGTVLSPSNSIWLRFDAPVKSDVNFQYVTRKASNEVIIDSGIPADTSWHTFKVSSVSGLVVNVQIDDNAPVMLASNNIPTAVMAPQITLANSTASNVTAQMDAFGLSVYGLNRVV